MSQSKNFAYGGKEKIILFETTEKDYLKKKLEGEVDETKVPQRTKRYRKKTD